MTRPLVNDAKTRFSVRVADYVRYRPGYPADVVAYLKNEIGLNANWVMADVGAGTGISARLFLDHVGCRVIAVEPNDAMRAASVKMLGANPQFSAIAGEAQQTGLAAASVDLLVCAQAFHWFEVSGARREFGRILKAGGWVVLMWNDRNRAASAFAAGYDALLQRYAIDYQNVRHDRVPEERIREFFGTGMKTAEFANRQDFDFVGLRGRLMSSSYAPLEGHPNHEPMIQGLRELYDQYQVGGRVTFEYSTRLFYGRLVEV